MDPKAAALKIQADKVIENMKKRNFEAYYCATKEEALEQALSLMEKGSSVANGGSESIIEIGLLPMMSTTEDYTFIDRKKATTELEKRQVHAEIMMADYYLTSANAFTKAGELIYIDGNGNRAGAVSYGPKHVIVVVSMNKMCSDVDSAFQRVRDYACSPNCIRLNLNTPCAKTGYCHDCYSKDTICDVFMTIRTSRFEGRIKVILVGEPLGY